MKSRPGIMWAFALILLLGVSAGSLLASRSALSIETSYPTLTVNAAHPALIPHAYFVRSSATTLDLTLDSAGLTHATLNAVIAYPSDFVTISAVTLDPSLCSSVITAPTINTTARTITFSCVTAGSNSQVVTAAHIAFAPIATGTAIFNLDQVNLAPAPGATLNETIPARTDSYALGL